MLVVESRRSKTSSTIQHGTAASSQLCRFLISPSLSCFLSKYTSRSPPRRCQIHDFQRNRSWLRVAQGLYYCTVLTYCSWLVTFCGCVAVLLGSWDGEDLNEERVWTKPWVEVYVWLSQVGLYQLAKVFWLYIHHSMRAKSIRGGIEDTLISTTWGFIFM